MSFADSLGGFGTWAGTNIGIDQTEGMKNKVLEYLNNQYTDADKLGNTAFSGISTDPRTRQAQMQALNGLSGLANANGLDPQAQAMQAETNRESAGFEQAQRQALQQNMAARGMGGSGAEVAGLMSAQQGSANRSSQAAGQAAAAARQRALEAMVQSGQLGGQIHAQDYQEAANKAHAQDQAQMNRYGAVRDARGNLANFVAANRAEHIGRIAGGGKALGGVSGGALDLWGSYATKGQGGGGGGGGEGAGSGYSQVSGVPWSSNSNDLSDEERGQKGTDLLNSWGGWGH